MDYKTLILRITTGIVLLFFLYIFFNNVYQYLNLAVSLIYIFLIIEVIKYFKYKKLYIILYLIGSLIFFQVYYIYFIEKYFFVFMIVLIIIFDSFSYFFGSIFGIKKILPNISPGKTYFGFFSGLIMAFIFSIFFHQLYFNEENIIIFTSLSILIVILSFIGDLIESKFKRINDIKNSGNILPGHGGLFDRFDGMIFIFYFMPIVEYIL